MDKHAEPDEKTTGSRRPLFLINTGVKENLPVLSMTIKATDKATGQVLETIRLVPESEKDEYRASEGQSKKVVSIKPGVHFQIELEVHTNQVDQGGWPCIPTQGGCWPEPVIDEKFKGTTKIDLTFKATT